MPERIRRAGATFLTVGLAVIVVVGLIAGDATPEDRVEGLGLRIKCPVCQGEAIYASPAETARAMMEIVEEKVAAGESDDEILEYFRARYTDAIILDPPFRGKTLAVWLLPLVALGVGIFMILGRRAAPRTATSGAGSPPSEER
jgi:cytochrome c-type biogenesis protein CcmH